MPSRLHGPRGFMERRPSLEGQAVFPWARADCVMARAGPRAAVVLTSVPEVQLLRGRGLYGAEKTGEEGVLRWR